MTARRLLAPLMLIGALAPALGQDVSGVVFEDRDADGVHDAGEPVLEGVTVRLFGAAGAVDQTVATPADGSFSFSPGLGTYVLLPLDPPGWRSSVARTDGFVPGPGYMTPLGQPRMAKLDRGVVNLQTGSYRYASLGDSIAFNFSVCDLGNDFWYSIQMAQRLANASGATVTLDQAAVKGEHTDDLLVRDVGELNNVFGLMAASPPVQLITLSMIGNDLLNVEPGRNPSPQQINNAVTEVLDARQNLQEALSTMVAEIPGADIALNSLYDNEAYNCYTGNPGVFHREWLPIVNRILRDLAWGQMRRISINEAAA